MCDDIKVKLRLFLKDAIKADLMAGKSLLRIGGSAGAVKRLFGTYYKQVVPLELYFCEELRRSNLFIVRKICGERLRRCLLKTVFNF
jgi:hypothetical protein